MVDRLDHCFYFLLQIIVHLVLPFYLYINSIVNTIWQFIVNSIRMATWSELLVAISRGGFGTWRQAERFLEQRLLYNFWSWIQFCADSVARRTYQGVLCNQLPSRRFPRCHRRRKRRRPCVGPEIRPMVYIISAFAFANIIFPWNKVPILFVFSNIF